MTESKIVLSSFAFLRIKNEKKSNAALIMAWWSWKFYCRPISAPE